MPEDIHIDTERDKKSIYNQVLQHVEALTEGEPDGLANLSNTLALLHHTFGFWWTGVYLVRGDQLVLGPFQGPVACTRITKGKGVCGTAWERNETVVVPDVDAFPGHIACSSRSRSEIVVPLRDKTGEVLGVLDIDSDRLKTFDDTDAHYLEKLSKDIAQWVGGSFGIKKII